MRNFVSGLLAGVISVTVCNPLDITRTRLNIMVTIILREEFTEPYKRKVSKFYARNVDDIQVRRLKKLLHRYIWHDRQDTVQTSQQFLFSTLYFSQSTSTQKAYSKTKGITNSLSISSRQQPQVQSATSSPIQFGLYVLE